MKIFVSKNRYNLEDPYAKELFCGLSIRLYTLCNLTIFLNSFLSKKQILFEIPSSLNNYFQFMPNHLSTTTFDEIERSIHSLELEQSQLFFKINDLEEIITKLEVSFYLNNEEIIKDHLKSVASFCEAWGNEIALKSYQTENTHNELNFKLINIPTLIYKYYYGLRLNNKNCIIRRITNKVTCYEPKHGSIYRFNNKEQEAINSANLVEVHTIKGFIKVLSNKVSFNRKIQFQNLKRTIIDTIILN